MESLYPDAIAAICLAGGKEGILSIRDVCHLCATSRRMRALTTDNHLLWSALCFRDLVHKDVAGTKAAVATRIGLAGTMLSWREFYGFCYASSVWSWGDTSNGRLGYLVVDKKHVEHPTCLPKSRQKAISFLGKTAETGACAISSFGRRVYLWGENAGTAEPVAIEASDLSSFAEDFIVDCSCHHDTSFLVVFNSGLVMWALHKGPVLEEAVIDASNFTSCDRILRPLLVGNERVVKGMGSQAGVMGFLTNKGNVLACDVYQARACLSDNQDPVPKCLCRDVSLHIPIEKVFFGHRIWLAIAEGKLYQLRIEEIDFDQEGSFSAGWVRVPGTERITDPIVDADVGSAHQAFVTAKHEVYTWGRHDFGMLAHGADLEKPLQEPQKVEFFRDIKVVAVGCGGFYDFPWYGGFTLFLTDSNELYMAGKLGTELHHWLPIRVPVPNAHILSISAGEDWAAIVCSREY